MLYHSTRNPEIVRNARQALLEGLAPDGGLYVTDGLEACALDVNQALGLDYRATALAVFERLLDDFTREELALAVGRAYDATFDADEITPVTPLGGNWLLELFHGPTAAFKDLALTVLPQLMSLALKDAGRRLMVLTATSGDTGKAALSGFRDVPGIGITVFFPEGKVSDIQRLQMVTQAGANVRVAAVRGNFDDVQTEVKNIFAKLSDGVSGVKLTSANSINIGRLIPQVVYYYAAYASLCRRGAVSCGQAVDFCVPTGNFGDVLAGYIAKKMGLPVGRLVVASNANNVLTDFFATGLYDRRRPFVKTISPSMDILVSSNLERLLYHAGGRDAQKVAGWMAGLKKDGFYKVDADTFEAMRSDFDFGFADDAATRETIAETYRATGRVVDTHTAVALAVAKGRRSSAPLVVLSTASPFKFSCDVLDAIEPGASRAADGFAAMRRLSEISGSRPPASLSGLVDKPVLHPQVLDVDQMQAFVREGCAMDF